MRPDALIATGRTDYPNQVNNVLCFPFIFRGALDVGATTITREMEIATVNAIAELARQEQSDIVATAYGIEELSFGPEYLIPKPFDPRLIVKIAPAVAKAAMDSGRRDAPDRGHGRVSRAARAVRLPQRHDDEADLHGGARASRPRRSGIVFAEGEEERVLRAVQVVVDEKIATPILIGRPTVIEQRIERYGLRLRVGVDYHGRQHRPGRALSRLLADLPRADDAAAASTSRWRELEMRRRTTLIGAMMIRKGEADGMICGTISNVHRHLHVHRRRCSAMRRRRERLRRDERADAAGPAGVPRRHARQRRPDAAAAVRDHDHGRRRRCCASASCRRSRCCRIRTSARRRCRRR